MTTQTESFQSKWEELFSDPLASVSPSPSLESHSAQNILYRVSVPVFDGPLDLLLHLIRKDQINIYNIPIAKICDSYLQHLGDLSTLDMNVAAEFMTMAATLIHIKSVFLLPKEELEEEDPRTPLVQSLVEYERFQKIAQKLSERSWLYRDLFPRAPSREQLLFPIEERKNRKIESVDLYQFLLLLKTALNRTTRPPVEIQLDTTSIRDKVIEIGRILEQEESKEFFSLLKENPTVPEIIVGFMAILELARLKFIAIFQTENFSPIQIRAIRSISELDQDLLQQY